MPNTVLVVDDSPMSRKFVTFALRAKGLTVLAAQDGLDALEKLAHTPVDLVITDLNMPKLDGYGLVRAIRDDPAFGAVPIIILSSLTSDQEKQHGFDVGADAYLPKPFDQRRIQYEVAKYIS